MVIDEVVKRIVQRQAEAPENRSLLVGVSGIDGCGKGYIAAQIEARPGATRGYLGGNQRRWLAKSS